MKNDQIDKEAVLITALQLLVEENGGIWRGFVRDLPTPLCSALNWAIPTVMCIPQLDRKFVPELSKALRALNREVFIMDPEYYPRDAIRTECRNSPKLLSSYHHYLKEGKWLELEHRLVITFSRKKNKSFVEITDPFWEKEDE